MKPLAFRNPVSCLCAGTRRVLAAVVPLLLATAVPVAVHACELAPGETPASAPGDRPATTSACPFDRLLYIRHNEKDHAAVSDTLVLCRVAADGFEQRDVYTQGSLAAGWHALGVFGGTLYAVKINDLVAIELATGRAENLCPTVRTFSYGDGRLYAVVNPRPGETALRIFDFRVRAFRDVGPMAIDALVHRIAVAPDHKRLAFFSAKRQDGAQLPASSARLTIVDLDS